MVGRLGERLAEVLPVQGLDVGILVREADGAVPIQGVQGFGPPGGEVLAVVDGLSAAAGAAAGA